MFFIRVSVFLFLVLSFFIAVEASPRKDWNYGKKNKEVKHHTVEVKIKDFTNKQSDNKNKKLKPGTPRDKY